MRRVLLVTLLALTACGSDTDLTVFAAASLTDAFDEIATAFEAEHPDVDVVTSYGGSSTLARQLVEGASAGVFASADGRTMDLVVDAGRVSRGPDVFARNGLAIAVAEGNPLDIRSVDDLARPGLVVVLCASPVPCGRLADEVLEGIAVDAASREGSVRAVLTKVALGEADAGVVYRTDVRAADEVAGIPIDGPTAKYPIAVVDDSSTARDFQRFVLGPGGRRILEAHGFETP